MKKTLLVTAALLSLISCVKDTEQAVQEEIVFTAADSFSAEVTTKATAITSINQFNAIATTGTSGSESLLWNNKVFSKVANDTKYTSTDVYWPGTQQSVHFYATNLTPEFSGGDVTIAANTNTDVLCAYLENPTWRAVNQLTFNHVLARLGQCTITEPDGYTGSNLSITLIPKTSGTYNLRTDSWSATNPAASDVTITTSFNGEGSINDIYLIPGRYTVTANYTLTKGTYTQSFTKTASVNLAKGCINQISATLPAGNASEIQFTVEVANWTDHAITANFQ